MAGQSYWHCNSSSACASSSAAKIRAYEMTVDSARTLVMATRKSIAAGVRVNLDVLNAQQELFSTRRDQYQAKYDYLLSQLRLKQAAGSLGEEYLSEINQVFH